MRRRVRERIDLGAIRHVRPGLTDGQLAAIGRTAVIFNDMEACVDELLHRLAGLRPEIAFEVSTRINGLDGKIEIINQAAAGAGLSAICARISEIARKSCGMICATSPRRSIAIS